MVPQPAGVPHRASGPLKWDRRERAVFSLILPDQVNWCQCAIFFGRRLIDKAVFKNVWDDFSCRPCDENRFGLNHDSVTGCGGHPDSTG